MSQPTAATRSGVTFPGLLTILFIGLKLTGHVNWPWLWVLSPLWITAALGLILLTLSLAVITYANHRIRQEAAAKRGGRPAGHRAPDRRGIQIRRPHRRVA